MYCWQHESRQLVGRNWTRELGERTWRQSGVINQERGPCPAVEYGWLKASDEEILMHLFTEARDS